MYSAVFRIYYDKQKPHLTGRIVSPEPGAFVGDSLALEAVASSPNGAISSVDFIGHYEDYDYVGTASGASGNTPIRVDVSEVILGLLKKHFFARRGRRRGCLIRMNLWR